LYMKFEMGEYYSKNSKLAKAVLVALATPDQNLVKTMEYLEELEFLTATNGAKTLKKFVQKLSAPKVSSFVGKGKLNEIKSYVNSHHIEIVVFDEELSPSQLRNLEEELKCKIYDRSLLILDIFLKRAKSAQAKTQVELARNQYLLPRLTQMWSHLERQRGGTGTRGGAGEKEIETDRRVIRKQISVLKEKLEKIDKQAITQRKSRTNIVKVSLVGYTNVGKSTIMNLLTKSNVFAEDKLFATVDSTVRKVVINHIPFLLTDTVGFIRKLPHSLIESFKSTLDEVRDADILLHVVDISHPSFEEQMKVVNDTLEEMDSLIKPIIVVFNKIDKLREKLRKISPENGMSLESVAATASIVHGTKSVLVSATNKENISDLRKILFDQVKKIHTTIYPNYIHDPSLEYE